MWVVYVLFNKEAGKLYIGQTTNLARRIIEHNQKRGNHFTAKAKGIWKLIYKENSISKHNALIREKQLKSYRGREFIKKFIKY